jgi:hypothetical protein
LRDVCFPLNESSCSPLVPKLKYACTSPFHVVYYAGIVTLLANYYNRSFLQHKLQVFTEVPGSSTFWIEGVPWWQLRNGWWTRVQIMIIVWPHYLYLVNQWWRSCDLSFWHTRVMYFKFMNMQIRISKQP